MNALPIDIRSFIIAAIQGFQTEVISAAARLVDKDKIPATIDGPAILQEIQAQLDRF